MQDNNFIFSPLDQSTEGKIKSHPTNEDLVNISGECNVEDGDSATKIKSTIFKEYRAGRLESTEKPMDYSDSITKVKKS